MAGISVTGVVALDAAGAERALEQYFPSIRFTRAASSGIRARVASTAASSFRVIDYAFEGRGGGVSNTDDFTVVHSTGRDYALSHGRAEIASADAFLAPRDGLAGHWSAVECVAIGLAPASLGAVARAASGREDLRLRRTGYRPGDAAALRHWRAVVADVRGTVATAPELLGEPMIERSVFEQLATAFLHAFPTNWRDEPAERTPSDLSATVRRAMDFVHAHAGEPITVQDIAQAVPISTRGLHYAFTRELGETPRRALQRVRLDAARTQLRAGSTETTNVPEVARRWGFAHVDRFEASYLAAYGELPSEALRR
ncbi:helix-turn-helix transcriptional regulator [Agromyces aerolatus]|uniref:helix-turn-helix transcriptional regulator n=1 Tax=Agromyces sp. LY-1074 TaxID=3074080 RepID=UPI002856F923|nr:MULTISPECIES: AraC family transcriptional regulator [unclassified Agromyces]MDR5698503.1 AraC family transcriptional regulator [Agromyces sp. LY-1074]MDR5704797.1 AraC family transcriptional regulator [Agromyces sp. LY-1358]